MSDPKDDWIRSLAPGKTVADIGGLWGTRNEKVSVALGAGAAKATMADIAPLDHELWDAFDAWCAHRGVSGYGKVRLDATAPHPDRFLAPHDIVHCSGVIYHVPDPYGLVANLRSLTREHLILTSMVVPPHIETPMGTVDMGADAAFFVPNLEEDTRVHLAAHFEALGLDVVGITRPMDVPWLAPDGTPDFGPWWWVWTPDFLRGLLEVAGFTVEAGAWSWEQRSYSWLARRGG